MTNRPAFHADNTEGFAAADLATLNAAFDRIMARQQENYSVDPDEVLDENTLAMIRKDLCASLNNAWQPGVTVDGLDAALRPQGW